MSFDVEKEHAAAILYSLGPVAVQKASERACREAQEGHHDEAAYWRRVTSLIVDLSARPLLQPQAISAPVPGVRISDGSNEDILLRQALVFGLLLFWASVGIEIFGLK